MRHSILVVTVLSTAVALALLGCSGDSGQEDGSTAADAKKTEIVHNASCKALHESIPGGDGYGVPGEAGAPRWGMPAGAGGPVRVRRSWSKLSADEKRAVIDAFVTLKNTTADSSRPGAARAVYKSFCDSYAANLYDFYVELHASAFFSMETPDMSHLQMVHMGSHFLPWHRYVLLRLEADLREASGNPDFTLPYFDWEDCQGDAAGGENPCPAIFDTNSLGSGGGCDGDDAVTGYIVDQGFKAHLWTQANPLNVFSLASLTCGDKAIQREVGCSTKLAPTPPTAENVAAIYERKVYDADPYDSCSTDENVSFRQYLEGYTRTDVNPACVIGGCQMHGQGHNYIGGEMASGGAAPNDPIFFLHHANVDRLWAMWQDANRKSAETAADYGNPAFPADRRGAIFNFPQVRAEEMLDFRVLGYRYDTNEEK